MLTSLLERCCITQQSDDSGSLYISDINISGRYNREKYIYDPKLQFIQESENVVGRIDPLNRDMCEFFRFSSKGDLHFVFYLDKPVDHVMYENIYKCVESIIESNGVHNFLFCGKIFDVVKYEQAMIAEESSLFTSGEEFELFEWTDLVFQIYADKFIDRLQSSKRITSLQIQNSENKLMYFLYRCNERIALITFNKLKVKNNRNAVQVIYKEIFYD